MDGGGKTDDAAYTTLLAKLQILGLDACRELRKRTERYI